MSYRTIFNPKFFFSDFFETFCVKSSVENGLSEVKTRRYSRRYTQIKKLRAVRPNISTVGMYRSGAKQLMRKKQ